MSNVYNKLETVYIHPSQFPDQILKDYFASFAQRQINHKFHYESIKQSQKWLNVHNAYSPIQQNHDHMLAYTDCYEQALNIINDRHLDLISLGCGNGEKEAELLAKINNPNQICCYYPIDVSCSLSITAAQKARQQQAGLNIKPIVCDLLYADDLLSLIPHQGERRLLIFFGMIPNFAPSQILPILSSYLEPEDLLLFSANLAPGDNYEQGIKKILPQYDNELTKDWLKTILLDAGIKNNDGHIYSAIASDSNEPLFKKVIMNFELAKSAKLIIGKEAINWQPGETVQLFYSYRYTTSLITDLLQQYSIHVIQAWESRDQEEGVYLCKKTDISS